MGKTPSFNAYYGKNDKGQKVKLGISFEGKKYPGINHPSEAKKSAPKVSTNTSTKTKKKGFLSRRKSRD